MNATSQKAYWATYYQQNKARYRARNKKWESENPDKKRAANAAYYKANKRKKQERDRVRRAADPIFRLSQNIRCRLSLAVREQGTRKHANTMALVGCTLDELRLHLEGQFLEGMSWDNYGVGGWHVDHLKPCASFDLADPEQQLKCFHFSNLRPLWEKENLRKGAKSIDQENPLA